jgi:hypothetical protein
MASEFEDALKSQISALEERRAKLASEAARIDGQLAGLRQALALFLGERPVIKSAARQSRVPDPAKSESWAFALSLMEKAGASGISTDEIREQSERAGYVVARSTLSANLSNASLERIIQRVSRGRYRKYANVNGHAPAAIDTETAAAQREPLESQDAARESEPESMN